MTKRGPLEDIVVLDLTAHMAGPFGTMTLADLGAEVIKIEEPIVRGPKGTRGFVAGDTLLTHKGMPAYFIAHNRNKKSVTIDLKTTEGKEIFYELVRKVGDVVFDNFRYGVLERLGINYETLQKINPRIIACSIRGFGNTGPYRDRPSHDLIAQSYSGEMTVTPEPGNPPLRTGFTSSDYTGGQLAVIGVLAAIHERERTGIGQMVDISLLDGRIFTGINIFTYYLMNGKVWRSGNALYNTYKTKDDYVTICPFFRHWPNLCHVLQRPDLLQEFDTQSKCYEKSEELKSILGDIFVTKSTAEWMELLLAEDVPCAPVNTIAQAISDPQVLQRDMVVTVDDKSGGQVCLVGNPIKMSGTPKPAYEYPPQLGEHGDDILRSLGHSKENINQLREKNII